MFRFDGGFEAEGFESFGGFRADGGEPGLRKLFQQGGQVEARMEMFYGRAACERDSIRPVFEQFVAGGSWRWGFADGLIDGDVVHNRAEFFEGFG